jgi:glucosamine kinase
MPPHHKIADAVPVIGMDVGGSGIRARLRGAPQTIRIEKPANLLGGAEALAAISEAVDAVCQLHGVDPADAIVAMAAAGDTPEGRQSLATIAPRYRMVSVVSDVVAAALGAHGGRDGGVIVLGTGAGGCVIKGGRPELFGGWGFPVDDVGSGADIGKCALRAMLRTHDGDVSPGPLSVAVARQFHNDPEATRSWARHAKPADFAAFAPTVFAAAEAGDPAALAILDHAMAAFHRLVGLARMRSALRVAVSGSVALRLLSLPSSPTDLVEPMADAVDGACLALDSGLALPVALQHACTATIAGPNI